MTLRRTPCVVLLVVLLATGLPLDGEASPTTHVTNLVNLDGARRSLGIPVSPLWRDDGANYFGFLVTDSLSFDFKDTPCREALTTIARRGNVSVSFTDKQIKQCRAVTLKLTSVSVETAFDHVLRDTRWKVAVSAPGRFVLVDRSAVEKDSAKKTGNVRGVVVDSSGNAVPAANVRIQGSSQSVSTSERGEFTLRNVPVGEQQLYVKLLGYRSQVQMVNVSDKVEVKLRITLVAAATSLSSVVTTATGIQRSYEVGSDVTRIDVDEVRKYNDIKTVAELLATRVPGMFNQSGGGDAGAGSTLRIRGVHSISLNNDPVLIIDGIRVATIGQTGSNGVTGGTVSLSSRLNDIDPASIETIEVLKGPSAATLYGPDAANGVIVITRKRGLVGETRWTINGSSRFSSIPRRFPSTRTAWGRNSESNDPIPCDNSTIPGGLCVGVDSISDYSPLNDPSYTTMGRGHNNDLGLSLRTGTSTIQTSLTFRILDQMGTTKLSDAGVQRIEKLKGAPVPSWARRPNAQRQYTGDANVTMQSVPLFDIGIQANASQLSLRNSGNGLRSGLRTRDSLFFPEGEFFARKAELTDMYSLGVSIQTRQWSWLNWSGTFGLQNGKVLRDNWERAEDCLSEDCSNAEGTRTKGTVATSGYSVNSHAGLSAPLSSWGSLRSTVGLNVSRSTSDAVALIGRRMAFGVSDPAAGLSVNSETQSFQNATAGAYLEGRFEFLNRIFFNTAIRQDAGSAIGQNAKTPAFPKFDVSWIALVNPVSVPFLGQLSALRLRAANGQSGRQPQLSDLNASILRSKAWHDGATHPVYLYQSIGNSYINSERTYETEMGIDLIFTKIIEDLHFTYFRHLTTELLIQRPASLETGLPNLGRTENLGKLRNSGIEASTSLRLIENTFTTWNLDVSFSQTKNKVLSLGSYSQIPSYGTVVSQRVVVGYPVFGIWAQPILGYEDRDHDGILARDEVIFSDSMTFVGWDQPKYQMNYGSSLGLWRGTVRISSRFSQRAGFTKQGEIGRSGSSVDDLQGQALDMASLRGLQTVSSFSWNSADVSMILPKQIIRRAGAKSGSISITASNLYQWTDYRGNDPNVGPVGIDSYTLDRGITPNTRNWALRFSLTY